jgi:hypothetical protein
LRGLEAVSFGVNRTPMAVGSCQRPGVAGVFIDASGTWRSAGLTLPAADRGDRAEVLGLAATSGGNAALVLAGDSLLAAWSNGTHWTVSAPATGVGSGAVRASGFGTGGSAWLLLGGGRAEIISGPGAAWQSLPPVPPGTMTLAPAGTAMPGPGGGWDALAVSGSELTVWRLAEGAWARVQLIKVPIEYGSSS